MRKNFDVLPTSQQLEAELQRVKYRKRYRSVLRSTVYTLITVAALAVLVATLLLPVLQIYGSSMTPTLTDGDIVLTVKTTEFKTGDVVAFYYNNKILVKRVIAQAGEWVDITPEGDVYVGKTSGQMVLLDEPYLLEKALGDCNIELPYQVPESRVFVMGDHRSLSVDSRNTAVGCVAEEQLVGKLVFRVWPLDLFGEID
jgi:signal peptidase I